MYINFLIISFSGEFNTKYLKIYNILFLMNLNISLYSTITITLNKKYIRNDNNKHLPNLSK